MDEDRNQENNQFIKKKRRPPSANNKLQVAQPPVLDEHEIYRQNNLLALKKNLNSKIVLTKPSVNMDAAMRKKLLTDMKGKIPGLPEAQQDQGLVNSMASRLSLLENQVSTQKHQLTMKDAQIKELLNKSSKDAQFVQQMRDDKTKLFTIIRDMSKLLAEKNIYNPYTNEIMKLIEKNSESSSESSSSSSSPATSPKGHNSEQSQQQQPAAEEERRINIDYILQKLQALNHIIEKEHNYISSENGSNIKKFGKRPEVILTFFKNGMIVDDGAFRPYEWELTKAFLRDVFDGYFPYEFKEKYPDGVFLKGIDKTKEAYTKTLDLINNGRSSVTNVKDMEYLKSEKDKLPNAVIDKETFLNRLPKSVIKNGKVIPIRSEIEALMKNPNEMPATITVTTSYTTNPGQEGRATTELKVKTFPVGKSAASSTLLLTMFVDETVGDLRKYITEVLKKYSCTDAFTMRTTFPAVVYDDDSKTLQAAGLTNANLILSKR